MASDKAPIDLDDLLDEGEERFILKAPNGTTSVIKNINELSSRVYQGFIIEFSDKTMRYAFVQEGNKEIHVQVSPPFKKVLYEFTESIIVVDLKDRRRLLHHHRTSFYNWMDTSPNYNIKQLAVGGAVLVDKNLNVSEPFCEMIFARCNVNKIYETFRIVRCNEGYAVIKINDLSSFHCDKAEYLVDSDKYVLITIDGGEALLKLTDEGFQVSPIFKKVEYSRNGYAFVSNDGENFDVMRLEDFKLAKF